MLEIWLKKLSQLRVDRASKNPAPHKPLLILAILDQIENKEITSPLVCLTAELAYRFLGYWEIVAARGRSFGRVELPFYFLQSDGFLHHVTHPGLELALASIRPTSIDLLNRVIAYSELPKEFFELMQHPNYRNEARLKLVNGNWFSQNEKQNLITLLGINDLIEPLSVDLKSQNALGEMDKGRDVRFRFQIVPLYRYTCVLCGIKQLLPSGITLVEAAHIHPLAHSWNNDVTNGMALCRNHHWSFDQGLWTVGQDYRVIVAQGFFIDEAPRQLRLADLNNRQIDFSWLAMDKRPAINQLEWHKNNCFIARQ
ncbi:MAG: HNH endonuclease [Proteobacteria bacterium]|nr:HNH endonuclease [Pseudomonadota bacterium]